MGQVREIIPSVCIHIAAFLQEQEQLALYNATCELSKSYTTTEICNPHTHYAEIASVDLTKDLSSNENFHSFLQKVCPVIDPYMWDFPAANCFTYLTGYLYPQTGKLAGHTDNILGYLIIVGLGSTANFWVMDKKKNKKIYIPFRSGDVIVFETSASSNVFHGVDNIEPDSCPPFFPCQNRISLQFRETITPQLVPPPAPPPSLHTPPPSLFSLLGLSSSLSSSPLDDPFDPPTPTHPLSPPPLTYPSPDEPWTHLPFLSIPRDIVLHIFSFLGVRELEMSTSTCHAYYHDPSLHSLWDRLYSSLVRKEREEREERLKRNRAKKQFFFELPPPDYFHFQPTLPSTTPRKLTKLKVVGKKQDANSKTVNLDLGSYQIRAGFCGEDRPYITRSLWAKDNNGLISIGDQCVANNLNYSPLMKDQVVQNYDHLLNACEHIFIDKLQVLPQEYYVLAQLSHATDKSTREKLTELAFEKLSVSGWYIATNYILAANVKGSHSGSVTIDIGFEKTSICFIYEGHGIPENVFFITINIGGNHITKYFKQLIARRHPNVTLDDGTVENLKHKLCRVKPSASATVDNTLFEECNLSIGAERYEASELFFNPSLLSETESIKSLPEVVVQQCQKYMQDPGSDFVILQEFYKNIILVGGGSMLRGLGERLENEIQNLVSDKITVNVTADEERNIWPWMGGSILGSLSTFSKMWISRPEYEESGPSVVHRKCF